MRLFRIHWLTSAFLAAILSAPAWGATPALPGTVNYVEGQVSIGNENLNAKSVGSTSLEAGQTISTETGKAEVLLTPGVFFRVGDDSAATLVSPSLTNTEVALAKGQAMVEVAEIHKDNVLRVQEDGTTTELLKTGVYGFDANKGAVRVFNGEAMVQDGDRQIKVKGGHELDVNSTARVKPVKFDKDEYQQTDLYRFSNLRSEYLAEANVDAARIYWPGAAGWYGAGWYWDPLFLGYTWIPGDGMFYSPFGWGFYSPLWVSYAPYYRGYPYGYAGLRGRPYITGARRPYTTGYRPGYAGRSFTGFRGPSHAMVSSSHFGVMGGGFHGGSGGFHGGGGVPPLIFQQSQHDMAGLLGPAVVFCENSGLGLTCRSRHLVHGPGALAVLLAVLMADPVPEPNQTANDRQADQRVEERLIVAVEPVQDVLAIDVTKIGD